MIGLAGAKAALDRALLDYQAQVGRFLQSGKEISDLRDRAAQYTRVDNADVVARAQAVGAKANGALQQFNSIESSALQAASRAAALKSQIETDPTWRAFMTADTSSLGTATLSALGARVSQISAVVSDLASIHGRMAEHLEKTMPALRSDLTDLDNVAQGKGLAGFVSRTGNFTSSLTGTATKWAIVVAGVALLGPIFLQGIVGALFAPRRNPPRRRRSRSSRRRS